MSIDQPDFAHPETEERMEEMNLPEGDRDEIRRFAEFLRIPKGKNGKRKVTPEMLAYLTGKDLS